MKKQPQILTKKSFLGLLICFFTFFIESDSSYNVTPSTIQIFSRNQIGDKDDPFARWRFEWLRTRDPQTNQIPEGIRQRELEFAQLLPTAEQLRLDRRLGESKTDWKKRGPYNVGGRTRALAVNISDENVLLAGGVSGGMWRSTDGGQNWSKTTKPEQLHSVTTIAQDLRTGKNNIWYYGTGEYTGNSANGGGGAFYNGDGIFKSTDGGLNWSVLSSTESNTPQSWDSFFDYTWRIRVNPVNGYVFAATYSHIYRSKDGGSSWEVVLTPSDKYAPYSDITISSTGTLYAVFSSDTDMSGVYRSADDGATWTNITPTNFPVSYNRLVLDIAPSNENILYLLGHISDEGPENHLLWKYTYVSDDGSGSNGQWTDLSTNLPAYEGKVGDFDSQNGYDLIVKIKPDDENTVYIGGTNLYMSTSGFADSNSTSWVGGYSTDNNFSGYDNQHSDQHSLVFLPSNPQVMLAGHDGGISLTEDDTQSQMVWSSLNNGYFTTQFYHVSLDPSATKKNLVMGGMQDNGTWTTDSDAATTIWSAIGSGDGAFSAVAKSGEVLVFSSQNGDVVLNDYRNPFNWSLGYTWFGLTPKNAEEMLFINPFILDPSNEDIVYYAGGQSIWRNNNIDMSVAANYELDADLDYYVSTQWEQLSNSAVTEKISSLGASRENPSNRLYYGTSDGKVYRLDSADEGNNSPMDITGSSFPSEAYVSNIAVDQTDGDNAVVVFSNYSVVSVWYTEDGGATWADVSGNLEQNVDGSGDGPSVRTALIMTHSESPYYFIGTSTGLYSTTVLNGSDTEWALESSQMIGNVVVDALAGRSSDGFVVVGTHGNGVFSSSLSSISMPAFSMNPASLSASLSVDGTSQKTLHITNTGQEGSTLDYQISWSYTALSQSSISGIDKDGRKLANKLEPPLTQISTASHKISHDSDESIISYYGDLEYSWDCPDQNNIPEWGTRFTPTDKVDDLKGAYIYWYSAVGTPNITVHVYGDNGGYPGTELGSVQVAWESIIEKAWNYVDLSDLTLNFETGEDFYITYSVDNGVYEELGLEILSDGGGQGVDRSYGYYEGSWYKLVDLFQSGTDYEWAIQAQVNYSDGSQPSWLTVSPTSGDLGYNETAEINVDFNAVNLAVGVYTADMIIAHNAVGSPNTVGITLNVFIVDDNLSLTAFDLVYPSDNATIVLTRVNFLDTLYFAWNQSVDPSGDEVTYKRELTGDLPEYIKFIVESNEQTTANMYKVPYHHIEHYMHEAGVELITGTWTIIATDGTHDLSASNGPFTLTIDGSKLNISDSDLVPETFVLHANYPNPFNPTTTISYDLPEQAQVTLGIYDLLGKQIKTLVNQSQDAGNKKALWDGTDNLGRTVSAGVYLYQIQAGEFTHTRKMLYIK